MSDANLRATIARSLPPNVGFRDWGTVARLEASLSVLSASVAVIDARTPRGESLAPRIRELRRQFPAVAVVVVIHFFSDDRHELRAAVVAGASDVLFAELDDPAEVLRRVLAEHSARSAPAMVLAALAPFVPVEGWPSIDCAVEHARERMSVRAFAKRLGLNHWTLARRLEEAGLPLPLRLLTWARLLVAAALLEGGNRTIVSVARELRFPSGERLRHKMREYLDVVPSKLTTTGGLALAVERFANATGLQHEWGSSRH